MLNEFGKFTRKLRVDKSERMADMAAKLGVSSAFLSSIELGKKPIPSTIAQAIIDAYNLDGLNALDDVIEQGGWVQSQNYKGNIFFIYAGKLEPGNKVYYNADTNKLTRSNGKAIR